MMTRDLIISGNKMTQESSAPEVQKAYEEMNSGTITPRTFQSRTFESLNDLCFKDKYYSEFDKKTVTLFGINTKKIELINNDLGSYKFLDINIREALKSPGSVNSNTYKEDLLKNVIHTNLEKELILKGLQHLLEDNNNTVLVDIFERDRGEILKQPDRDFIETHTVVLYKNKDINSKGETEIIVLDPNNFIFSSHLKYICKDNIFNTLREKHSFVINTKHSTFTIYKSTNENDRDCTDIAVKIALGLESKMTHLSESNSEELNINLDKLKDNTVIKLLSNQSGVSSLPCNTFDNKVLANNVPPVRIKQATSTETVKIFNQFEENTSKIFQEIFKVTDTTEKTQVTQRLTKEHAEIFKNFSKSEDMQPLYSKQLALLHKFNSEKSKEYSIAVMKKIDSLQDLVKNEAILLPKENPINIEKLEYTSCSNTNDSNMDANIPDLIGDTNTLEGGNV